MHNDTAPADTTLRGTSITLGDKTFIVPPLSLRSAKELLPRLNGIKLGVLPSADDIDTMVDVVLAAIKRNYPDIERDALLDLLDLANVGVAFRAITASGTVSD